MITENLSTLKINKLTQAQYDRALDAGNIDPNAFYLTPDEICVKTVNGASPDENGNINVDSLSEEQIDSRVALALGGFETGKETVYVYTLYIDQFAGSIETNTVAVYPDIDTWASSNINWTYSAMLKPTSIANQYEVVKAVIMPVEVVQAEKGSGYTPTSDDFKALFSSEYGAGYIFIAAHGYAENAAAWKMERSKGVIVKISGVDFANQTCTNAIAYIMTPDLSGIDLAVVEGKSAYETAQEGGYTGTEAEFTEKLANGLTAIEDTTYTGCYYRIIDGEQEWINPPMVYDVEYRTTERHNGAIVYTRLIQTDTLDSTTGASKSIGTGCTIVSFDGKVRDTIGGQYPLFLGASGLEYSAGMIVVKPTSKTAGGVANIVVKYTKA